MAKSFRWIALVGLFVFSASGPAFAQGNGNNDGFNGLHLTGVINDFTTPMYGAWVMHGTWTLDLTGGPNAAQFTAALSMERSDLFVVTNPPSPATDAKYLTERNTHTHHIMLVNGTVTATATGFRVTTQPGQMTITGNGAIAPFEPNPPTSTLQIDVTGGSIVTLSNITLTFGGAAATHFGTNPIAGVVTGQK